MKAGGINETLHADEYEYVLAEHTRNVDLLS